MCESVSEHDELMALVARQQKRIAELTTANEELHSQLAESRTERKASGCAILQGQAQRQAQASWSQAWYGAVQLP